MIMSGPTSTETLISRLERFKKGCLVKQTAQREMEVQETKKGVAKKQQSEADRIISLIPDLFVKAISEGDDFVRILSSWGCCKQDDICPCFFDLIGSARIIEEWAKKEGFRFGVVVETSENDPDDNRQFFLIIALPKNSEEE